jgi:hypothetical protein
MMTDMLNLSWINSTILDLYIVPSNDWHMGYENFNLSLLNLTWSVVSFNSTLITFDLVFVSPPSISPLKDFDKLVWHVKDPVYFMSK